MAKMQSLARANDAAIKSSSPSTRDVLGRRSFMKRLGIAGAALPAGALLTSKTRAHAEGSSGLTAGDVAILRFLAAVEILETDLWQQYTELALGNESFALALEVLDGDMPSYVNQNTRDEFTHQNFLNQYLISKGQHPVDLSHFKTLPSSQATGSNKSARRLTNLMNLTVDTSWFLRYRLSGNPDFGDSFPQIVTLQNLPGIPNSDLPSPTDVTNGFEIQLIANTAGFHFATIEQGGSSLYLSFLHKVTSLEVLRIVGSIGGTEIMHFQTWQDKAGNSPMLTDSHGNVVFPQLPTAPALPDPVNGTDPASPDDTNQIMPAPCKFISAQLPLCSVIRPSSTLKAGAVATVKFFTDMGLFQGQNSGFFARLNELAQEADAAVRQAD
ncbi:MAG TPA: twin-arginine translocation signal domain-containing protein [Verrucomicrobiae bacterium]|nr:twin-arginine translocation signal domain-containing protein [Verrucomicrobiae bacterium]